MYDIREILSPLFHEAYVKALGLVQGFGPCTRLFLGSVFVHNA